MNSTCTSSPRERIAGCGNSRGPNPSVGPVSRCGHPTLVRWRSSGTGTTGFLSRWRESCSTGRPASGRRCRTQRNPETATSSRSPPPRVARSARPTRWRARPSSHRAMPVWSPASTTSSGPTTSGWTDAATRSQAPRRCGSTRCTSDRGDGRSRIGTRWPTRWAITSNGWDSPTSSCSRSPNTPSAARGATRCRGTTHRPHASVTRTGAGGSSMRCTDAASA